MRTLISERNYIEKCSDNEIALHCEADIAPLIAEGICRIFAEYPKISNKKQLREKLILVHLKKEIEKI